MNEHVNYPMITYLGMISRFMTNMDHMRCPRVVLVQN